MPEEKGYQGWANYETWATMLWINNDESIQVEAQEIARRGRPREADQALKAWIEEMAPDLGPTLYSDLLQAAIDEVDWREITNALREE